MSSPDTAQLQRTALFDAHVAAGARMVAFAGWEMPIQYEGVIAEHKAVRSSAGLFDVSHMGQLLVSGPASALDLQRLLSNDIEKLGDDGAAQYTLLTNERGGIEDDLIVYRRAADEFLLVVNAANVEHDLAWIRDGLSEQTSIEDHSARYSMFALQGPLALEVLAEHLYDARTAGSFRFEAIDFQGNEVLIATTGYTGEPGCELLVPNHAAVELWGLLTNDARVSPVGLAARDTLRLEVCYPLHGNDIGPDTSAVAAGLSWVCGWSTEFVGRDALRQEREHGSDQTLRAIKMSERGIPRPGCDVVVDGEVCGQVTSGTMSPCLGIGVALAYVRTDAAGLGDAVEIDVRGKRYAARIEQKPLYRKESA